MPDKFRLLCVRLGFGLAEVCQAATNSAKTKTCCFQTASKSRMEDENAELQMKVSQLESEKSTLELNIVSHLESDKNKLEIELARSNSGKSTLEIRVCQLESKEVRTGDESV